MSENIPSLAADQLRKKIDPESLSFRCTASLSASEVIIGQEKALKAIRRAVGMDGPGFNLFAVGLAATGRHATVRRIFDELRPRRRKRRDFVFVQNLENPARPRLIVLPVGRGDELKNQLRDLRARLPQAIKHALEQEVVRKARDMASLQQEVDTRSAYGDLDERVREAGLVLGSVGEESEARPALFYAVGEQMLTRAALRVAVERGEVTLDRGVEDIAAAFDQLSGVVAETVMAMAEVTAQRQKEIGRLEERAVLEATRTLFEPLRQRFYSARSWLRSLHSAVSESFRVFTEGPEELAEHQALLEAFFPNIIHRGGRKQRAPVVVVGDPSFVNVFGGVDMGLGDGSSTAGFTRLRSGAILDADGGHLVFNARALVEDPVCWRALKRVLVSSHVVIRNPENITGGGVAPIRPDPIPVDVKVVLLGDPTVYDALRSQDPDFSRLFKIKAEFETEVELESDTPDAYGTVVARIVNEEGLKHLDAAAVARLVEEAIRWSERGGSVSTRFGRLADVVREASFVAEDMVVKVQDLQRALDDREERVSRSRVRMDRVIREGRLLVELTGTRVGQINGLAVYHLGDSDFGRPFRLTAQVGAGKGGVVSIEREVGLSGRTHDKGVQILTGFLRGHFARNRTVAFRATIGFEQSSVRIDGDSASAAELFVLLSSLGRIPLRQDVAVTGALDQLGNVQAIGGVNDKIEGFFRACRDQGLSGTQGVLIPSTNVPDLMLNEEVVEACESGLFHVWPISRVEQGLALLTGMEIGSEHAEGERPEGSLYARIEAALDEMEVTLRAASKGR